MTASVKFEKFKRISENYLDYLRKYEPKIPTINYDDYDKFFFGVVLNINNLNYYVPVSSFNIAQATNTPITDSKGNIKSTLRYCFMLPIPNNDVLLDLDLSNKDNNYINLVNLEYQFCLNNFSKIQKKAKFIYDKVCNKVAFYAINCCNYKLLEQKCLEYLSDKVLENKNQKEPLDLKALKKEAKEYNKNRVASLGKKKKHNLER